jgi:sulfatase-modifying factor enzyme 1
VFRDGHWTPLCELHPTATGARVYAHRFRLGGVTLWALINRSRHDYTGVVLAGVDTEGSWWDVTGGTRPHVDGRSVTVSVPAGSIAGLVHVADDGELLPDGSRAATIARRLAEQAVPISGSTAFPRRVAHAVNAPRPRPLATAPADTITVSRGRHTLRVIARRRETGLADEAPWVEVWKPSPPDLHAVVERFETVELGTVAVDRFEVTQAQYAQFLGETGYRPRVAHRHVPQLAGGRATDEAVTYVDLDDARAYAAWRGGRLPTPAEWQLAQVSGAARRRPLVWNWTDSERTDGITRYSLLKGGSDFAATGSSWYVDGGPQPPEWELKFVLPGGGLQRSSRIGFRCAYDLSESDGAV